MRRRKKRSITEKKNTHLDIGGGMQKKGKSSSRGLRGKAFSLLAEKKPRRSGREKKRGNVRKRRKGRPRVGPQKEASFAVYKKRKVNSTFSSWEGGKILPPRGGEKGKICAGARNLSKGESDCVHQKEDVVIDPAGIEKGVRVTTGSSCYGAL